MNLVAKEFVASQTDDPGVLLLSRMAGAAETMREALRVNPYNFESVAEALHRALVMPLDEREARMRALQRRERKHDLGQWLDLFIDARPSRTHATRREGGLRELARPLRGNASARGLPRLRRNPRPDRAIPRS